MKHRYRIAGFKILFLIGISIFLIKNASDVTMKQGIEEDKVILEGIRDGIESMTGSFVYELIPMKQVLEGKVTGYKESIVAWMIKEFLPVTHFKSGYEAKETVIVDNQDYLYLMEENEEENQEEMQRTELQIEAKRNKKDTKATMEDTKQDNNSEIVGYTYTKEQLY
ncbi:MAG: hypothetical protein IAC13_02615, partial [Firmicutes bacterium]|nr:hypothetical protein [Candidatus Scybalomonas excrementavium]